MVQKELHGGRNNLRESERTVSQDEGGGLGRLFRAL